MPVCPFASHLLRRNSLPAYNPRDQIHPGKTRCRFDFEVDSRQGDVADLDILVAPLAEEENGLVVEVSNLLRQLNGLNIPGVGHLDCRGGGGGKG